MVYILTSNTPNREDWLQQLAEAITDPMQLLQQLQLDSHPNFLAGLTARRLFPLRVPRCFVDKMVIGDANDPLLRQVITDRQEFLSVTGFTADPLLEQNQQVNTLPGLLHKYHNRVLLIVKGGCAVHCRYCFRRHFPYQDNAGNKTHWQAALDYIARHPQINEVILSGGDPLMAKDDELAWLIERLANITHLQRLRIHTRLPVVIPSRITDSLCQLLADCRLQTIMVTHINHANEIDTLFAQQMKKLKQHGVTLLNQSVLLKGVNDDANSLIALSEALFTAGILPYYLHLLDKVAGAAHFWVDDQQAKKIMRQFLAQTSGYLVPRLTREIGGQPSKTWIDLQLLAATDYQDEEDELGQR